MVWFVGCGLWGAGLDGSEFMGQDRLNVHTFTIHMFTHRNKKPRRSGVFMFGTNLVLLFTG